MPNVPQPLVPALRSLGAALNQVGVEWRLGGSAMLAALGIEVAVGDLDVTVAGTALDDIRSACEPWVASISIGDPPAPWCSAWLATLDIAGTPSDVIGDLCVLTPRGRVRVPQDAGATIDLDGVEVTLADPAVWWWVYRAYKPAKADLLAQIVPAARCADVESRLGPV